ncbi:MAG: M81 family metallopeptidase [Acidobacteria bacterium]|nr:M81 family metallopeptidase [Acidobacteriota bacterium]
MCAARAITANRLLRADFERLVSEFEEHLRRVQPDALLLAMHGAQTAAGEDDVEGCVLERARTVLGRDRPIVITLDLHANITRRMVELSNAIVGYQTYPHIDMFETGQKAARLMVRILKDETRPQMAFRKLPLIIPPENSQTHRGPMHKLIRSRSSRPDASDATGKETQWRVWISARFLPF